jgi:hypothetical protein
MLLEEDPVVKTEHPSSPLLHVDCLGHIYAENEPNALTSKPRERKMKS